MSAPHDVPRRSAAAAQDALPLPATQQASAVSTFENDHSPDEVTGLPAAVGLEPLDAPPYLRFGHRVDQVIGREPGRSRARG
ncbi:MAG TPA: hypothetical protein VLJ59_03475 [Mycobacteriales bacterium]|nr:hypothetical protein [Mycobacteriales bacterium]